MSQPTQGGAALPVAAVTDRPVAGRTALPVAYVTDRPVLAGAATPVYEVGQAELDAGAYVRAGGPALPISASAGPAQGGPAMPVYVVGDSPEPPAPTPPAGLLFQVTARDATVTRDGSDLVSAVADDYGQVAGFTSAGAERPTYSATDGPDGAAALVFAGAQRLSMAEASEGQSAFALECWGYLTSDVASQMWIGSDQDASNYYVNLYPAPIRVTSYLESGLSVATISDNTQNTPTNAWVYAVIVKDGNQFRLYVNGVEVATAAATVGADPTPGYGWQIGNSTLNEPLTGRIHQVAWWSVAPLAGEIAARYAAGPRAADGSGF